MDLRKFERAGLTEAQMFHLAQLLPVLDKVLVLVLELYPERIPWEFKPTQQPRLNARLLAELAPKTPEYNGPIFNNDRNRKRRSTAKK